MLTYKGGRTKKKKKKKPKPNQKPLASDLQARLPNPGSQTPSVKGDVNCYSSTFGIVLRQVNEPAASPLSPTDGTLPRRAAGPLRANPPHTPAPRRRLPIAPQPGYGLAGPPGRVGGARSPAPGPAAAGTGPLSGARTPPPPDTPLRASLQPHLPGRDRRGRAGCGSGADRAGSPSAGRAALTAGPPPGARASPAPPLPSPNTRPPSPAAAALSSPPPPVPAESPAELPGRRRRRRVPARRGKRRGGGAPRSLYGNGREEKKKQNKQKNPTQQPKPQPLPPGEGRAAVGRWGDTTERGAGEGEARSPVQEGSGCPRPAAAALVFTRRQAARGGCRCR